jgi:DNA-cytosine methyltransferase
MAKHRLIRYVDLFAGCGGLGDGFEASGKFMGVGHVEWDSAACATLRNRLLTKWGYQNADSLVIHDDIQNLASIATGSGSASHGPHPGLDALVADAGGLQLVIGGPPCQAYSVAGRIRDANGMQDDYRNYLFESYLAIVQRYAPKAIVFENVPGMLSAKPGGIEIAKRIRESFKAAGFVLPEDLKSCLVDMAHFGLPQVRKRVIIVGLHRSTKGADALLEAFYNDLLPSHRRKPLTAAEAIGDLPQLLPLKKPLDQGGRRRSHRGAARQVPDHEPRFHSVRDQGIFKLLALDRKSANPKYQSVDALKMLYTERTGKSSSVHKYHVIDPDRPSNLIPAHLYKDGLRHIHFDPKQARSITVREAARLQGFPDDYCFLGSQSDRYKMIGNAVPPMFARCLANAVSSLFHAMARGPGVLRK